MRSILLLLALVINSSVASVDFTYSTLYDIEDFKKLPEVRIPKCNEGCLIFASTFVYWPSDYDHYAENLLIYNSQLDRNISISDLSRMYDSKSGQKTPMSVQGPAKISVFNVNAPGIGSMPIFLYVVEERKAASITYEVYDAIRMVQEGRTVVSPDIITVMSAFPFTLKAMENIWPNSVTARLVGFDNALDSSGDECPIAYSTAMQDQFAGFVLNIVGPIISLSFTWKVAVEMEASAQFLPTYDLSTDGFVTPGGYNGCRGSGGIQYSRSSMFESTNINTLYADKDKYNVTLNILPNLDNGHNVSVYDNNKHGERGETITGYDETSVFFDNTDYVTIVYDGMKGDQGFLLRYSSVALPRAPTTTAAATSDSTASAISTSTTSTTATPTTSSSNGMQDALLLAIAAFSAARMM